MDVYTTKQWEWIADRYHEGYSLQALADWLDLNRNTVRMKLDSMGCRTGRQDMREELDRRKKEFMALYEEGDD